MSKLILIFSLTLFLSCNNYIEVENTSVAQQVESVTKKDTIKHWLNLAQEDSTFIIEMPYATTDNFLKEKIYPCAKCLLREEAATALLAAQTNGSSKRLQHYYF